MARSRYVDSDIAEVFEALNEWSGVSNIIPPKNKRGERTRAHIIRSAETTFIQKGFVDSAVEDIIQQAEISRGTFYSHFRSRRHVFAAVIEQSVEGRMKATDVSDMDNPLIRDRIMASVRKFLQAYAENSGLSRVIEQAANTDPEFRTIRLLIRDSFSRRIARGIRRQQAQGVADPECDPAMAGLAIVSMMTNFAQVEIGWRKRRPNEDMVDTLTRFWCAGIGLKEDAPNDRLAYRGPATS